MSSSNIDALYPIPFQISVISANLNSTLIFFFLTGGYIGFYAFTLWIYAFTRSAKSRKKVTIILTALFATALGQLSLNWYFTYICSVRDAQNRRETFVLAASGVAMVNFLVVFMQGMSQIFADALLIWRAYHILTQRRYLRLGLVFLYVLEAVLIITGNIMNGLYSFNPSTNTDELAQQYNIVVGTSLCVTVATSVLATLVIGAQIYASTGMNRQARRRYMHIVEIVIQSSGLYSISILLGAVTTLINTNSNITNITTTQHEIVIAEIYATAISSFATSFAPTLMVARLELSKERSNAVMMSETQDEGLSVFRNAMSPQDRASDVEKVSTKIK